MRTWPRQAAAARLITLGLCLQVDAIRAALAAFGASQANFRQGKAECDPNVRILRAVETPKFAPSGRTFAVMVAVEAEEYAEALNLDDIPWGSDCFCIVVAREGAP